MVLLTASPLRRPPLAQLPLLLPLPLLPRLRLLLLPLPRPLLPPVLPVPSVKAPMPGNILDVKVAAGASVKAGDVLVILEAMKMENEIVAPQDGTVASVNVNKGDTVNSGDVLVSMN